MKAIVMSQPGKSDVLQYKEVDLPPLKSDEVRVKLAYAALNHVDIWVRQGSPAYPAPMPHIIGADGAGTIEEIGHDVEGVSVGDQVVILPGISCAQCPACRKGLTNQCEQFEIFGTKRWGTYAEMVTVPDRNVLQVPKNVPLEKAAAFPVAYLTAYHMLLGRAQLKKSETVLIVGASAGISIAAIQIAKRIGATVLGLTTSTEKIATIKRWGADDVLDISNGSSVSDWAKQKTSGLGVDVVFEHVGPATWESSVASLKRYGRLVTCGATTGPNVSIDLRQLFSRDLSILGARMGTAKEFQDLSELVFSGQIEPVIDKVFDLSQAAEAHLYMEDKKQIGKILLKI